MSEISRVKLFEKLNSVSYKAIESATVFCKLRGNPYVELVHWLYQILQSRDSDVHRIVRHFRLDPARLAKDLTDAVDRLPRGATSIQDISSNVCNAVERGWVYGSLMFGDTQVRTGHLMVGMLKTASLRSELCAMSLELDKIDIDRLTEDFGAIVGGSPEASPRADGEAAAPPEGPRLDPGSEGRGRATLFNRLNGVGYRAIESATIFCKLRGNPYVELVHWFHQILQSQDSDIHHIVRHFRLDSARLERDFTGALDRLPRGATEIVDFSPHVDEVAERGWFYARQSGAERVRTGHLFVGALNTHGLRNALHAISGELDKIDVDRLTEALESIVDKSPETPPAPETSGPEQTRGIIARMSRFFRPN